MKKKLSFSITFIVIQTMVCFSQHLVQERKLWSNTKAGTEKIHDHQSYWVKFQ
jgi:hypothetical protein